MSKTTIHRFKIGIVWLLPLALSISLYWITGFNGLYGQDPHEYLRYTQRLSEYFQTGVAPGAFFWPIYYPLLGSAGSFLFSEEWVSLLFVSSIACGGISYWLWRTIETIYPEYTKGAWYYTILWCTLSPFLLRSGVVVMSDALSLFFIMLYCWGYFRYLRTERAWYILLLALSGSLATFVRYGSAIVLLLPSLYILIVLLKKGHWRWLLLSLLLVLMIAFPHISLKEGLDPEMFEHTFWQEWSVNHWWQRSFVHDGMTSNFRWPNLVFYSSFMFHPGYFFFGPVLLIFVRRKDWASIATKWLLAGMLVYVLFLAGVTYQNQRYPLVPLPLMLLLLYPAYQRLLHHHWWQKGKYIWITTIILIQLGVLTYGLRPLLKANILERTIAAELKTYPSADLYTFYVDIALPTYGIPQRVHSLWAKPITIYEPDDLILFNPSQFVDSWTGHILIDNWQYLQQHYHLEVEQTFPEGWLLYRLDEPENQ